MPLTQVFVSISDLAQRAPSKARPSELLTVAVCGCCAAQTSSRDIEAWAKERIDWLRAFWCLSTASRRTTPSDGVRSARSAAIRGRVSLALGRPVVSRARRRDRRAIDGKTSRRSTTKAEANPLHMVSAFAADIGLVLGQTATAEKSNEIVCHERTRRQFGGCGVSPEMRVGPRNRLTGAGFKPPLRG